MIITAIILLPSCQNKPSRDAGNFRAVYPDTSITWAGQATGEDMRFVRMLEAEFGLPALITGTQNAEIRLWRLESAFDHQTIHILRKLSSDICELRTIKYARAGTDRLVSADIMLMDGAVFDSLQFERYRLMPSQSDMPDGDSYGCMDGGSVLIELADTQSYALKWYRCPRMHEASDSTFLLAAELIDFFDALEAKR
jgi:hypothetical protein